MCLVTNSNACRDSLLDSSAGGGSDRACAVGFSGVVTTSRRCESHVECAASQSVYSPCRARSTIYSQHRLSQHRLFIAPPIHSTCFHCGRAWDGIHSMCEKARSEETPCGERGALPRFLTRKQRKKGASGGALEILVYYICRHHVGRRAVKTPAVQRGARPQPHRPARRSLQACNTPMTIIQALAATDMQHAHYRHSTRS